MVGELDELERELRRLGHADRLAQAAASALERVDGDEGLRERLAAARATLRGVVELDPELAEPERALERARLELDEAALLLERYAAGIEADPRRLAQVEERLGALRRLQPATARRSRTSSRTASGPGGAHGLAGGEARTAELEAELAAAAELLDQRAALARAQ